LLLEIKEKYAPKKRHIFRKIAKNKRKTGYCLPRVSNSAQKELGERGHYSEQRMILEELRRLTSLVKKLERRIANLERKLAGKNRTKKNRNARNF